MLGERQGSLVDFLETGQVGWGSTEYIVLRVCDPERERRHWAATSACGVALSLYEVAAPRPIAELFGRLMKPHFARLSAVKNEALRNALLPKLISGVLRVRTSDHIVGKLASTLR